MPGSDPSTAPTVVAGASAPATLGKFRIEARLGEGGMGVVYRAQDERLRRTVALKVLKPALCGDRQFVERFLREAQAAARVSHPHVVSILEADQAGDTLYLAFEFVPGGDLAQRIRAQGPLPAAEALRLLGECAEGLAAIHRAGLIHRDIKPGNIFLDADGHAKLGDLGLARSAAGDDRMTMTGVGMGTPAYMSPEQVDGLADIDIRSDIHALGGTFFAMLTGKTPFDGATPFAVTAKVLTAERPHLAPLRGDLPPAFDALAQRAMARRREERFATPAELLAAVRALAGAPQAPVPAPAEVDGMTIHPPHLPRPAPVVRRRRWPLAAAGLLALAAAGTWVALRASPARVPAPAPVASAPAPAAPAPAPVAAAPAPAVPAVAPDAARQAEAEARHQAELRQQAEAQRQAEAQAEVKRQAEAQAEVRRQTEAQRQAEAQAEAQRQAELSAAAERAAAAPPAWAARSGGDAQGRWAELAVGAAVQRLRWIPPGTFTRGSPAGEAGRAEDERQQQVTLTRGVWMAASECTRGFWQAVAGEPAPGAGGDDLPVDRVSWDDCQRFCAQLARKVPGLRARLPSEAEWEYACRAGSAGAFAGPDLAELGWFADNAGGILHPVSTRQANAWGLHDLHGNVLEWCSDWLGAYPGAPVRDPAGPAAGEERVVRGGSVAMPAGACRSAFRFGCPPAERSRGVGFRIVVE